MRRVSAKFFFIASGISYSAGVVHYAFTEKFIVPALGGWFAGLLLMEGLQRSSPRKKIFLKN